MKVNNDDPDDIINDSQLLVLHRCWIIRYEVVTSNDGMLHMFTVRFHLMWMHSAFRISSIKVMGPCILFALLSIHNNQS